MQSSREQFCHKCGVLCQHAVPLQESGIEVLRLDALNDSHEEEVEHALHLRIGLN